MYAEFNNNSSWYFKNVEFLNQSFVEVLLQKYQDNILKKPINLVSWKYIFHWNILDVEIFKTLESLWE